MKQFENKILFIKDEEMLKHVKTIINNTKFKIDDYLFDLGEKYENYLNFSKSDKDFYLGFAYETKEEITLEQFKELLKQK